MAIYKLAQRVFARMTMMCAFAAATSAQPCPVTWGPTIQISNTSASAFSPKLVAVRDTVHVAYHAGAVFYSRSTNAGESWSSQMEVVPAESMSASLYNSPLAVSGQALVIVWANRNSSGAITSIKIRRSINGGETWLQPQTIVNNISTNYQWPIIAANGQHLSLVVIRIVAAQWQCFFTRSTDGGTSWDSLRQITFVGESHVPNDIWASPTMIHFVMERAVPPSGREIVYMRSSDFGLTWSSEEILSTIDNHQAWEPNVSGDVAGDVYVCWQDAKYGSIGGFAGTVLIRKSTDNGFTWSSEIIVSPLPSAERSSLAVDENAIHIVWEDERNGVVNRTVQYRGSTDRGETWCQEQTVGDTLEVVTGGVITSSTGGIFASYSSYLLNGGDAHIYFRRGSAITNARIYPHVPEEFVVLAPYPNPFNPSTRIQYALPREGRLVIKVFDNLGRVVTSFADESQKAGKYTFTISGAEWSSGIYHVVVYFNNQHIAHRVVLLK